MRGMCSRSSTVEHRLGRICVFAPRVSIPSTLFVRAMEARGTRFCCGIRKGPKPARVRCNAVSEKSLFIQGILLTRISLLNQVSARSSTSWMNGRIWRRIPLGRIGALNGSARPLGFA